MKSLFNEKNRAEGIRVTIESMYHRDQFDDWLAGGRVEINEKIYYWSAQDSSFGFGWEIEPVDETVWTDIAEDEFEKIASLIKKCLSQHPIE
ncbi:MAG TPA: hypothetical protein VI546_01290 [candidate division Zixibacteria bacterium]|nr:hypothetical protein [candidate division Zixibacteria bacterium]